MNEQPRDDEKSEVGTSRLARFVGAEPTRDLDDWHWLWTGDRSLPIDSHRGGLLSRLVVGFKKLLRPIVRTPQQDLWDRQRIFNLIVIEELRRIGDLRQDLDAVDARLRNLETCFDEGLREVARYNDALYSRVDLKLERTIAESRRLQDDLRAAVRSTSNGHGQTDGVAAGRAAQDDGPGRIGDVLESAAYVRFEDRHRGDEDEIRSRLRAYVAELSEHAPVLDLGCGRGELLQLLAEAEVPARGIDSNPAMVRRCRDDLGLDVRERDLASLTHEGGRSLGAITLMHVVEHLDTPALEELLRSARQALRPGGLLLIETPNPLSLVAGARDFWLDATHLRPVHPELLRSLCETHGFVDVGFSSRHPFPESERLPDLSLADLEENGRTELGGETRRLFEQVAAVRDRLDTLLFGDRDYTLRAYAPAEHAARDGVRGSGGSRSI